MGALAGRWPSVNTVSNTMDEETKQYLQAMEERLVEKMRDMQTEIIRAMTEFQTANE